MSLFGFLDKLMGKLPIQGRTERWRNEIDNLIKERETILKGQVDVKKIHRIRVIDKRINYLNQLCKNAAKD